MSALRSVFLTWQDSRRSRSLARSRGLGLVILVDRLRGVRRHLVGSVLTALYLARVRPDVIWFQFSFGLGVVLAMYAALRKTAGLELVADVHTKALRRDGGSMRWLMQPIKSWALRACTAVLVTNEENAGYANRSFGIEALTLADPLPTPRGTAAASHGGGSGGPITFVCSFARDEPVDLIRMTAEVLGGERRIAITGDAAVLSEEQRADLATVASLTGFLPEGEYWRLLAESTAIVVLTTERACLPCGAYEAIAVGRRPVLLEDAGARALFGDLAIYAPHDHHGLAAAVDAAAGPQGRLQGALVAAYRGAWQARWEEVRREIDARLKICGRG